MTRYQGAATSLVNIPAGAGMESACSYNVRFPFISQIGTSFIDERLVRSSSWTVTVNAGTAAASAQYSRTSSTYFDANPRFSVNFVDDNGDGNHDFAGTRARSLSVAAVVLTPAAPQIAT